MEAGGSNPLRSVFPTEERSGLGFWSISKTTENIGACAFIDYMCRPEVQQVALTSARSSTAEARTLSMSDEDYEVVAGPGPEKALRPKYEMYDEWEDWIDQNWTE